MLLTELEAAIRFCDTKLKGKLGSESKDGCAEMLKEKDEWVERRKNLSEQMESVVLTMRK